MRKIVVLAGVLAIVGAACSSGGSSESEGSPSASASESASPSAAPTSGGPVVVGACDDESSGDVFNLEMKNTAFEPKCVIARSEQSIHIENKDGITHNFTITGTQVNVDVEGGSEFNGESAGLAPGTYQFFCRFHKSLGMTGQVTVK